MKNNLAILCGLLICLVGGTTQPQHLIITNAVWGDLSSTDTTVHVTDQIAKLVKNDSLSVRASNDLFGDPAEGSTKELRVEYTIDGVPGSKIMLEGGLLRVSLKDKKGAVAITKPSSRLIIRKAVWGDLDTPDSTRDVTAIVADMVSDNALLIKANNDDFGDPAAGATKHLRVDYTFDGHDESQTVQENQSLEIRH